MKSLFRGLICLSLAVTAAGAQDKKAAGAPPLIDRVLDECWKEMGARARGSGTDEFAMVQWLSEAMRREGLVWEHGPNVSCGPNSADSHYEPEADRSKELRRGDFVLIDLWGKLDEPGACYSDIEPPPHFHSVPVQV